VVGETKTEQIAVPSGEPEAVTLPAEE